MAGRGIVAQKTAKARKLMLQEALYIQGRGISADYESGRLPWDSSIIEARKNAQIARNTRAYNELKRLKII